MDGFPNFQPCVLGVYLQTHFVLRVLQATEAVLGGFNSSRSSFFPRCIVGKGLIGYKCPSECRVESLVFTSDEGSLPVDSLLPIMVSYVNKVVFPVP